MKSLLVIILILILAAFTGYSSADGDDDDTTGDDDDDDQVAADTAVINIINNTGYKTRLLLAESDELDYYVDLFDIYDIDPNVVADVIIEPGINNSESYTLQLGNEQTAVRDWALQYVDPAFVLEWRGRPSELMDRFVFQAGKTYTITITSINLDMFHIDFTISCNADPVVKVVNHSGDTGWFVLTSNDDCIYFDTAGGIWIFGIGYNGFLRPDEPEDWGEGTSEIANGIPENIILDLGTDTSVLMDWGLYYLAPGGDMQALILSEENDRYEFERGRTYIVNINDLSAGSSDYSITEF